MRSRVSFEIDWSGLPADFRKPPAPKAVGVQLYTNAKHAVAIHDGRKRGARGPVGPMLEAWVRSKASELEVKKSDDEAVASRAWAIAIMIHRFGFSPAHHGGRGHTPFVAGPLNANGERWLDAAMEDMFEGRGLEASLTRIGNAWLNDAQAMIAQHWMWKGRLSNSLRTSIIKGDRT